MILDWFRDCQTPLQGQNDCCEDGRHNGHTLQLKIINGVNVINVLSYSCFVSLDLYVVCLLNIVGFANEEVKI